MKKTKIKMKKEYVDVLDGTVDNYEIIPNRIDFLGVITNLIANGYYDDVILSNKSEMRNVNASSESVKKAREHIKELGISSLNEVLEMIINFEIENARTDFGEEYAKMNGVAVEEETINDKEVTEDEEL